MKKNIFHFVMAAAIGLCMTACGGKNAKTNSDSDKPDTEIVDDEDEEVTDAAGKDFPIIDIITAIVGPEDAQEGECFNGANCLMEMYKAGEKKDGPHTVEVDAKHCYASLMSTYEDGETSYTEFCSWKYGDGHLLVCYNSGCNQNGRPIATECTGLSFYDYDMNAKTAKFINDDELGVEVDYSGTTAYTLPTDGSKAIGLVVHGDDGSVKAHQLVWKGSRFNLED
jgi:hypothetical protein